MEDDKKGLAVQKGQKIIVKLSRISQKEVPENKEASDFQSNVFVGTPRFAKRDSAHGLITSSLWMEANGLSAQQLRQAVSVNPELEPRAKNFLNNASITMALSEQENSSLSEELYEISNSPEIEEIYMSDSLPEDFTDNSSNYIVFDETGGVMGLSEDSMNPVFDTFSDLTDEVRGRAEGFVEDKVKDIGKSFLEKVTKKGAGEAAKEGATEAAEAVAGQAAGVAVKEGAKQAVGVAAKAGASAAVEASTTAGVAGAGVAAGATVATAGSATGPAAPVAWIVGAIIAVLGVVIDIGSKMTVGLLKGLTGEKDLGSALGAYLITLPAALPMYLSSLTSMFAQAGRIAWYVFETGVIKPILAVIGFTILGFAFMIIIILFIINSGAYITPWPGALPFGSDTPGDPECFGERPPIPTPKGIRFADYNGHKYAFPIAPYGETGWSCSHWDNTLATDIFIMYVNRGGHYPVVAYVDGTIVNVIENDPKGGKYVIEQGDDGRFYYYAHHCYNYVSGGQRVIAGQVIATTDNTGTAATTPEHLHFAISSVDTFYNGGTVCPSSDFHEVFGDARCEGRECI